jgi:iron complex outermembrane recepter protein
VKKTRISNLKITVAPLALGLALLSTPSFAQEAPQAADEEEAEQAIVVTGTIFRRTDAATPSPVTVVTTEDLDKRGVTTIQDAIQTLSSNNGPALTNSFTANGAFGAGASAVSLRGLSTSSTLVLFDGLRAAYYPLSDDGARNFVDLNTIQDDIVERIEVLRDGASSSYGADAIAGVVNIITKKQVTGVSMRAEAGVTSRGDAPSQRISLTAGTGDLEEKGFNAYVSGFYYNSKKLKNSQRPFPYGTDDLRDLCYDDGTGEVCGPNNVLNGLDANGGYTSGLDIASNFLIRPYDATNTTAQGRYRQLNPALGCGNLTPYTLTPAEFALPANAIVPATVCQEDITNRYGNITPNIQRFGGSFRVTAKLGDATEAYVAANFQQSTVNYTGLPATIRANAPAGILFPRYSTSATTGVYGNTVLTLPVFVCPRLTVGACTAANGTLNPNNPFAAAGQVGRLLGRFSDLTEFNETRSRVYRVAAGLTGEAAGFDYQLDLVAMHNDLRRTSKGYIYIQHLLDVIKDGTYNFVNPALNSQAVRDYVSPDNITDSSSDLYQAQITGGRSLLELPGGPLQLGLGASIRYEAVDAPSANPDYNGPTQRYFRLNAFGTAGSRTVYSGFGELNAPIVDMVEVNLSARYDKYSSGQSAFSPKAGIKFTPIKQLAIRGTYSKGYRIPSFAESNALPTTGFVTNSAGLFNNTYLAQYGCTTATFSTCPSYIRQGSYGLTTIGTTGLEPEKSRSFTGGFIFEPIRNVTLTFDYYNIKKTNAITSASTGPAIAAYYNNLPIPTGINVVPDAVDPNFPLARPRIAFVESGFVNADTVRSEGLDFSATGKFDITDDVSFTSSIEGSYILNLSTTFPDGTTESYEGTLGNFNLTAGSGTPKWRGTWQNTLDYGPVSVTGTANYYGGYNLSAEDQGGVSGDCGLGTGYTACDVKRYITFDLVASVEVNDKFTLYANMINAFDKLPPIDPSTYGAHLYNAVQGGNGILGRQFRAGVRVNF